MTGRFGFFALCFLVFAALCATNVFLFRGRIENELTARTFYTAKDAFAVDEVKFDGRDATVVASVADADTKKRLQEAAAGVWGVRVATVIASKTALPKWRLGKTETGIAQSGLVGSKDDAESLASAAKNAFPQSTGIAEVDASVARRPYLKQLSPYMALLAKNPGGGEMDLANDVLTLSVVIANETERDLFATQAKLSLPRGLQLVLRLFSPARETTATVAGDPLREKLEESTLYFGFDSATVLPQSDAELVAVAKMIRENPSKKVRVLGYTDALGSDRYNHGLGARRSNSVIAALVQAGVPRSQLVTEPRGKKDFVSENKTPDGQRRNRRVEFAVESGGAG